MGGVSRDGSIVRENDGVTVESMLRTNDLIQLPPAPFSHLTPEAVFTEMSSAEMPHGHGLLSSHSCTAPTKNQAPYANWVGCHPRRKAFAQR